MDKHNGAIQLVLGEHQHGGFKESVGYDETDATCCGISDAPDAGAMNRLQLGNFVTVSPLYSTVGCISDDW